MHPVNAPGVVNISAIFVRGIGRYNKIIVRVNGVAFVANAVPAFSFYAMNQYILGTIIFSFPVMKSSMGIITNICNM
jgi:hypothetical protein